MAMWGSVPVEKFIAPVIHLPIGLGDYFLSNLLGLIDYDVKELSTGE